MHNHTLGWTSDNGCNVFAVGWLIIGTLLFTPGGGIDDGYLKLSKRKAKKEESEFAQLLAIIVSVIDRDTE